MKMRIALFDTHEFEREYFTQANSKFDFDLTFFDVKLNEETVPLVHGFDVVCPFVHGVLNAAVLREIRNSNIQLIALRSVGFNHVDLEEAFKLDLKVLRVPEYSPYSVAEHAVALILALNRKLYRSYSRVREGNFSLDGLVGFDLFNKTVGIIGTGKIGSVMINMMKGFGCEIIAYDPYPNPNLKDVYYVSSVSELYKHSDIISIHIPLTPNTHYFIDEAAIEQMKKGVMIINTGRGALIDTQALIAGLKSGQVGYAGLDVYEEEEKFFFEDLSNEVIQDDVLARLMTFPNVIVTAHQGFLTREALANIAETTLQNISDWAQGKPLTNQLNPKDMIKKSG